MPSAPQATGISSWQDAATFIKKQIPDVFTKGKFNFITIHYIYIIVLSIFWSVVIYGIGDIPYIDALFFASGSCTQSGLNTVDVNLVHTGQQVCFYLAAMMTNPIVIHGSVVFVRLYWFEKRFEDIVKEARALRRTKSKGRSGSIGNDDEDVEMGRAHDIKERAINVFKKTGRRFTNKYFDHPPAVVDDEKKSLGSSQTSPRDSDPLRTEQSRRNSNAESQRSIRLPSTMNTEQHITFLENQRNPKDDETLRIPSPREFESGGRPENIDSIDQALAQVPTRQEVGGPIEENDLIDRETEAPAQKIGNHLTFNEPEVLRNRPKKTHVPPRLNTKRTPTMNSRATTVSRTPRTFTLGQRTFTMGSRTQTLEPMPYLSYEPTVARNSFFVNLTEEQREELGGIEYRALKTLALILIGYFFGFHIFAILCLTPWITGNGTYGAIVTNDGQGRPWWGVFTAASAFNDLGFTLTPDSMLSFQTATWPLLSMTFLIIIGNTGFPCMLRFTIWFVSKFAPVGSGLWEELHFLLDHPRRCFTLLFPRSATWWLFAILFLLNGLDLFFFVVLDLHDETVTVLSGWFKFLDGLFQAASTRTAGFSVVNLAALHPAIQVSYLIMMYISVFPIAISMRRTNVYEEKSLGIYTSPEDAEDDKEPSYVGAHLRRQLSFDLWYVFLGLFIIAIVEGDRLENTNEYAFTLFSVLFEIVSAYGTVGLSLGYPNINASFSAEFKVISKLVIIAMQIRGRHRGLPYELDRAVLLPSETLHAREEKEAKRMISRRPSMAMSITSAVDGTMEDAKFRHETGLASGYDLSNVRSPRDRRGTNKSHGTTNSAAESQHSTSARRELGNIMFKAAQVGDTIKEEVSPR